MRSSNREAEVYHLTHLESGRHLYGGWFHFVGFIVSGSDAAKQVAENSWQPDLEGISPTFHCFPVASETPESPGRGIISRKFPAADTP
jgi:hypothetical protein